MVERHSSTTGHTDSWFAACPKGIESLLARELQTLGASETKETVAGVSARGPLAFGYRACLWSRLANRILMPIAELEAKDDHSLYQQLLNIHWDKLFAVEASFAVDFIGRSHAFRNTQFGAQRCKDAIVDWFTLREGKRPTVARQNPDIRLNVRLNKERATLSLDFSGGSLHRRGYRLDGGAAPLKENLAAAVLLRADWPAVAARGGALLDPMCGSATLLLEGAMMIADIAPGLSREHHGFEHWWGHKPDQWQAIYADAQGRAKKGLATTLPEIRGYDADPRIVLKAQENIARLGLTKQVRVTNKALKALRRPTHAAMNSGLLICNPPYGERLGEKDDLRALYNQLGKLMSSEFEDWQAGVLTSELALGKAVGLRSHKRYRLYNGKMEVHLLLFNLKNNRLKPLSDDALEAAKDDGAVEPQAPLSQGAQMFQNRIRKNAKRLASWRKREGISCYRLYDADMPEYAVAIDVYGDHLSVSEYQAPESVDARAAAKRFREIEAALPVALNLPPENVFYKRRQRQRGAQQYEKLSSRGELISVNEGAAVLLVNLQDYLDTGLFLDHRPLRLRLYRESNSKTFLNLFCYTASATVHAALGGARSSTSVDMSNTYMQWARRNYQRNGIDEDKHRLIKANCLGWLASATGEYDLILLDPPSFSNSSAMAESFDVQRDHLELIRSAMALLHPQGTLYFSNNRRGFSMDCAVGNEYELVDITSATLDPDFRRKRQPHRCWQLQHKC
ncbi:MAG: bifunctional 23S rRNA (guanine(2069)-N(7))-methyltransferase RlmK/23S rRNA (guanine(2445)-N(2))-methyltransferase RlmL [Pseudomonadota bacterium]